MTHGWSGTSPTATTHLSGERRQFWTRQPADKHEPRHTNTQTLIPAETQTDPELLSESARDGEQNKD